MKENCVVEFKNVCKIYDLRRKKDKNVIDNKAQQKFYALKDISFSINRGEIVGILGSNGSGKSTLSAIIAGISTPTSGRVNIKGDQSLIAINTGLNNQLTGFENIRAKGALLGLSKSQVDNIIQGVIDFAELGDFLYQPVKSYSSGMKARLGFAISISLNPDIIIIDEALSVGDSGFANKCIKKMEEFKNSGKTIFFVSHSLNQVKSFCNKALWIEGGELKKYGEIEEVAKEYHTYIEEFKRKSNEEKKAFTEAIFKKRLVNEDEKKTLKDRIEFGNISKNNVLTTLYSRLIGILKKYKAIITTIIITISCLSIIGIAMNNNDKPNTPIVQEDNESKELIVNKEETIQKFNYLFLIQGEEIDEYKNQYRSYLNEQSGKTIFAILNIEGDSEGKLSITNIPISLQFYYESLMLVDEIRFCNVLDSEINFNNIEKNVLGKEIDEIFILEPEKLIEFARNLGVNLDINNNDFIWSIEDKNYLVNHGVISEDNTNNFKDVSNEIINRIIRLTSEDKNKYLGALLENNFEKIQDFLSDTENYHNENIDVNFNDITTEKLVLENLITNDEINLIPESSLLKREIVVSTREYINGNIYYKAMIEEINDAKEEFYGDLDVDNNADNYNNSNNGQSSGSTGQTPTQQRPTNTPGVTNTPDAPTNSDITETPSNPGGTSQPEVPNEPEIPNEPEVPSESETPIAPESSDNNINID